MKCVLQASAFVTIARRAKVITLMLGAVIALAWTPTDAREPLSGPLPVAQSRGRVAPPVQPAEERGGLAVDARDRSASLAFYRAQYRVSENVPIGWNGAVDDCAAGASGSDFRAATLRRINYYRAMAGVPADVVLSDEYNRQAQAAALMMLANWQLNHSPPADWRCYSAEGATGASNSNLALGAEGPRAIDLYMSDPGNGNYAAGHRRWILYPPTRAMGTGDVSGANALWVLDRGWSLTRPLTRDPFVAWPPPGYVPQPVVFARWSFSYPYADFDAAVVSMTANGRSVPVVQERVQDGYGDNTLVWRPQSPYNDRWTVPGIDTVYSVTIGNVVMDGVSRQFRYDVIVIEPQTSVFVPIARK